MSTVPDIDAFLEMMGDDAMEEFAKRLREEYERQSVPAMNRLDLFVTHRCNLRCDYCFLGQGNAQDDISLEVARASIDLLIRSSRNSTDLTLTLFGGEPLLRKDLMRDILALASAKCDEHGKKLHVACTTNGLLLDEEAIELSQQYGFLYLLSIDGIREVHDRHRRTRSGAGSFDRLARKIAFLKARQGWLGAKMTVAPDAMMSLAQGVRELYDMGIRQFLIGLACEAQWTAEQLAAIKEQYREVLDFCLATRAMKLPIKISGEEGGLLQEAKDSWGCSAGIHGFSVDASGRIYPCARHVGLPDCVVGEVATGKLDLEVVRALNDTRGVVRFKCLHCELGAYCRGGCPASNQAATRSPYWPGEVTCALTKALVELYKEAPKYGTLILGREPPSALQFISPIMCGCSGKHVSIVQPPPAT